MVTLTARHKGLYGNEIPVTLNYYGFGGGEVLPAGVNITVASGVKGLVRQLLTTRWQRWEMSRSIISAFRLTTRHR